MFNVSLLGDDDLDNLFIDSNYISTGLNVIATEISESNDEIEDTFSDSTDNSGANKLHIEPKEDDEKFNLEDMKTDSEETASKTNEKKLTKKDVVHFSNFACDFCEITFKQETDLLKHVSEFHAKTNTNEKISLV